MDFEVQHSEYADAGAAGLELRLRGRARADASITVGPPLLIARTAMNATRIRALPGTRDLDLRPEWLPFSLAYTISRDLANAAPSFTLEATAATPATRRAPTAPSGAEEPPRPGRPPREPRPAARPTRAARPAPTEPARPGRTATADLEGVLASLSQAIDDLSTVSTRLPEIEHRVSSVEQALDRPPPPERDPDRLRALLERATSAHQELELRTRRAEASRAQDAERLLTARSRVEELEARLAFAEAERDRAAQERHAATTAAADAQTARAGLAAAREELDQRLQAAERARQEEAARHTAEQARAEELSQRLAATESERDSLSAEMAALADARSASEHDHAAETAARRELEQRALSAEREREQSLELVAQERARGDELTARLSAAEADLQRLAAQLDAARAPASDAVEDDRATALRDELEERARAAERALEAQTARGDGLAARLAAAEAALDRLSDDLEVAQRAAGQPTEERADRAAAPTAQEPAVTVPVDGEEPQEAARRRRFRPTLPGVMFMVGALIFTDGLLTITWKEPISSFYAARQQSALDDDLEELDAKLLEVSVELPDIPSPRERMEVYARRLDRQLRGGNALGRLKIPRIGTNIVVVHGTGADDLRKGPGHYSTSPLPGERGTVGIAGHRTTYGAPFRRVNELRDGDTISMTMPYGKFVYVVEGKRIVKPSDTSVLRNVKRDRLVLTACHPLYSAEKRIIITAALKRATPAGPALKLKTPGAKA
ncbi:sortase [Paraconexibacter sp.]|uniref:sortase n=1 Tax=Paraconexibacter sp. TaxID=2949640 RepID=UPI0035620966